MSSINGTRWIRLLSLTAVGILSVTLGACSDDPGQGPEGPTCGAQDQGTEGCSCFPNRTCAGELVCGPAGRCERPTQDAGSADASDAAQPDADDASDAPAISCKTDEDCDSSSQATGNLCLNKECHPCQKDEACAASTYYGKGSTCSSGGQCVPPESCVAVGCPSGGVCDPMSGACRAPKKCSEIGCSLGQLCQDATTTEDATCLPKCETGLAWNPVKSTCDPIPPNCRKTWPNSILSKCVGEKRKCVETETSASCTDCFPGYVDHDGTCAPAVTCSQLDCGKHNRTCKPETESTDAVCTTCLPGYGEHFGKCEQAKGATCDTASSSSILAACASQGRTCVAANGGAACGPCVTGRVENPSTGECEVKVSCTDLSCGDQHRHCEDTYNAHCATCLDGYVEDPASGECVCAAGTLPDDNGKCEKIRTCADIQDACKAENKLCIEATADHHATCRKCPEGQTWYEHQQKCLLCPPCTQPGETGQLSPIASQMGHCVCETLPGYFHSEAGLGGTFACDSDGDGWVTELARDPMGAPDGTAEKTNARCNLRTIDQILLRNEWGDEKQVLLSQFDFLTDAVPLYEPANRDRDDKLVNDYDYASPLMSNYAPVLGPKGRHLKASELNPLTKACATGAGDANARYADYNADGTPDVDDPGWADKRQDPEKRLFAMFSYYVELYRGYWEPVPGQSHGRYVIEEKTRSMYGTKGHRVELQYPPGRIHWRTCHRHTDASYSPSGPVQGFDFAQFGEDQSCQWGASGGGAWCGMNHESQFKCILAVQPQAKDADYPNYLTGPETVSEYVPNTCSALPDSVAPDSGSANPHDPELLCNMTGMPSSGSLMWAAAKYRDYGHDGAANDHYVRGCVNDCSEQANLPADERCQGSPTPSCKGVVDDYGRLFCYRPLTFVEIPMAGNTFMMGSPSNELGRSTHEDLHQVSFTNDGNYKAVMVTTTEVTQDQFLQYMKYNPSRFPCGNSLCPVEQVSWYDAIAMANVMSDKEGLPRCYEPNLSYHNGAKVTCSDGTNEAQYDANTGAYLGTWCRDHGGIVDFPGYVSLSRSDATRESVDAAWKCDGYRLLTEAEWEYLARGKTQTALPAGNLSSIDCAIDPVSILYAWTCADSGFGTHAVGQKAPNPFGLYDMHGNVWEWVSSAWKDDITGMSVNPDYWKSSSHDLVATARGGAWNRGLQDARSARRTPFAPGARNYAVGFRLARTVFEVDYRRYEVVPTGRTWQDAENDCQSRGGHLASIASPNEQRAVRKAILAFIRNNGFHFDSFWIGLPRDSSGQFTTWTDGTHASTYEWKSGEPNNKQGNEDCVALDPTTQDLDQSWYDIACNNDYPYVCEK